MLDFRARIQAPPDVIRRVRASVPEPAGWAARPPESVVCFGVARDEPAAGWHRITRDGARIFDTDRPGDVAPYLVWAINWAAVERLAPRYLLLHAGVVGWRGQAILLPAASGSGKTTLVAGLLAGGFEYLTDDIAPMDVDTGLLLPFAKGLSLKPGGRRPLHRVYRSYGRRVPRACGEPATGWSLVPRTAWPAGPLPVRHIVVPQYVRGGRTRLEALGRGAVVERVFGQTFNLREHGAVGVGRIVEMVREADCHALTIGRLGEAVAVLRELAAGTADSREGCAVLERTGGASPGGC